MTDIELFAGGGGLAVGLCRAGFADAQFYEIDRWSCETLRRNASSDRPTISGIVLQADVTEIAWALPVDGVRLLAAGAPCQPFSLGGKHLAHSDGRNLFPWVFRAARELRPQAMILENVRGLLRDDFRPYFEYILRQLECPSIAPREDELWQKHDARLRRRQCSLGYEPEYQVVWRLLEAADFGVPQLRQRVIMVATRSDFPVFRFPMPTHSEEALRASQTSGVYWEKFRLKSPRGRGRAGVVRDRSPRRLPWLTVREAIAELPPAAASEDVSEMNHWLIPGARTYAGHAGSGLDSPAKTIKAGVHGVPGGENSLIEDSGAVRYFTLRELARLQTFPNDHYFVGARTHVTRQIGNAVPCLLAHAIGRPLLNVLSSVVKK